MVLIFVIGSVNYKFKYQLAININIQLINQKFMLFGLLVFFFVGAAILVPATPAF